MMLNHNRQQTKTIMSHLFNIRDQLKDSPGVISTEDFILCANFESMSAHHRFTTAHDKEAMWPNGNTI